MCGIVCYLGKNNAKDILIDGLEKLEYRGYDSSGIALMQDEIKVFKKSGKLKNLKEFIEGKDTTGNLAIGHIRWATHGKSDDVNSHPHVSACGNFAVAHNGIIENYAKLKEELKEKYDYKFYSETDTEVIAALLGLNYNGDFLDAVSKTVKKLEGSYALGIISKNDPETLIGVKNNSPLVVGLSDDEYFLASDISAFAKITGKVSYPEDLTIIEVKKDSVTFFDYDLKQIEKKIVNEEYDIEDEHKNGFKHFMLKEIYEQPTVIRDCIEDKLEDGHLKPIIDKEDFKKIDKIYMVACGTAYHAGLIGKYIIEKWAKIPVICDIASEFRYSDPFVDEHTLVVFLSQSGETADTIAALKEAKRKNAKILTIVNQKKSTLERMSDMVMYCKCKKETAVASTKAYTTMLVCVYVLALELSRLNGKLDEIEIQKNLDELKRIPEYIEETLKKVEDIKNIAEGMKNKEHAFYIGRSFDYYTAVEASLKLKEVSYIHTEAFQAGELKHGTIALIEKDTPVFGIITRESLAEKSISNIEEVIARGAKVTLITPFEFENSNKFSHIIKIDAIKEEFYPFTSVVIGQLLAYHTACFKNLDVDKPRNLAKSVTVE